VALARKRGELRMGAILPILTTIIGQAPGVVNLVLSLLHPDGSTTVTVLAQAAQNDTAALTAIAQLQAAVAAKNAVKPS
jgi:hypothetical protein